MSKILSIRTVHQYLPAIKEIVASTETGILNHSNLSGVNQIRVVHLEKKIGYQTIAHAMSVMNVWLKRSSFEANAFYFIRKDKKNKWEYMLDILHKHITTYDATQVIELHVCISGEMVRVGTDLSYSFEDKRRLAIIRHLTQVNAFMKKEALQKLTTYKSIESLRKAIGEINKKLQQKLQLPQGRNFIEHIRDRGYRINPLYNVVFLKK